MIIPIDGERIRLRGQIGKLIAEPKRKIAPARMIVALQKLRDRLRVDKPWLCWFYRRQNGRKYSYEAVAEENAPQKDALNSPAKACS